MRRFALEEKNLEALKQSMEDCNELAGFDVNKLVKTAIEERPLEVVEKQVKSVLFHSKMLLRLFFKDRDKRRRFAHIGAGIVILIHAYEKYEGDHNSYIFFSITGTIFLFIAIFHSILERKIPWVNGTFLLIEGILSLVLAYEYVHARKKALPTAYLLIALFQFYMASRKGKKGMDHHPKKELESLIQNRNVN